MILGVGIDITQVEKIARSIESVAFQRKTFTLNEIKFCTKIKNSAECFAGKFAAKEAFMKALGLGIRQGIWFSQIEVLNNETGKPYMQLNGEAQEQYLASGADAIHISVTHSAGIAVAVVILEK
jgi:holo-[acyl-carrier protein] synthase